jgi:lysozyme family protein
MSRVDDLLWEIVRREGGLVDHENDRGGITNHGVSLRYARNRGLDLNGDGEVDGEDIRDVTADKAVELYREDFYTRPRIDRLPEDLQPLMTDFAVNSGAPRAIMELQGTLERTRAGAPDTFGATEIAVDGVIGPGTSGACKLIHGEMGSHLVNAVASARLDFLHRIVERDPSQKVFLDGWEARVREFMVEV